MNVPQLEHIDGSVLSNLISDIQAGNCVAFVGAGFSMDGESPTWAKMVEHVIDRLEHGDPNVKERLQVARKYLKARRYDDAAEAALNIMEREIQDEFLAEALKDLLPGEDAESPRASLLARIPFQAVLTTNYDGRPEGQDRGPDAYHSILRGALGTGGLWDSYGWDDRNPGLNTIALHGRLDPPGGKSLVLTRRHYRDLLYRSPGYQTFLRSLFATSTVLFLGKSFDDEYINELRSEVIALIGGGRLDRPIAYAAVHAAEFDEDDERYLRNTEAIQLLRYGSGSNKSDHSGFNELLRELYDRTNFFRVMQRTLAGQRVLWMDTNPEGSFGSNDVSRIMGRIEQEDTSITIDRSHAPAEAIARIRSESYDFLISNWGFKWGHVRGEDPAGLQLLDLVHENRIRVPVIIFAAPPDDPPMAHPAVDRTDAYARDDGTFAAENRALALGAGAYAFETSYDQLFRRIYEVARSLNAAPN